MKRLALATALLALVALALSLANGSVAFVAVAQEPAPRTYTVQFGVTLYIPADKEPEFNALVKQIADEYVKQGINVAVSEIKSGKATKDAVDTEEAAKRPNLRVKHVWPYPTCVSFSGTIAAKDCGRLVEIAEPLMRFEPVRVGTNQVRYHGPRFGLGLEPSDSPKFKVTDATW